MTDKLNQSLDAIMTESRGNTAGARRSRRPRRAAPSAKATKAPVGGVQKSKPTKPTGKATAVGPRSTESKIIVSNLPFDVTEDQLKEYFSQTVGGIKKCTLAYGPDGRSRGSATIVFGERDGALAAAKQVDGLKVDGRPMKVEVILGAKDVPAVPQKSLSDRIAKPKPAKAQPKPATATKKALKTKGGKATRGRGRGRNLAKRTLEELDTEMVDYFTPANAGTDAAMATNGGAVQPTGANGDAAMEDEIE